MEPLLPMPDPSTSSMLLSEGVPLPTLGEESETDLFSHVMDDEEMTEDEQPKPGPRSPSPTNSTATGSSAGDESVINSSRPSLLEGAIRYGGNPMELRPRSQEPPDTRPYDDQDEGQDEGQDEDHGQYDNVYDAHVIINDDSNNDGSYHTRDGSASGSTTGESQMTELTEVTSNVRGKQIIRHVDDECKETDYELNIFYHLCEVTLKPETPTSTDETRWANIRRWLMDHKSREERYAACVQQGIFSATPLHLICQNPNCPIDIVRLVIGNAPETTSWEDTNGWLPLHYGCAKGAGIDVLNLLLDAYPEGMVAQDRRMRTPLHFAFYKSGNEEDSSNHRNDSDVAEIVYLLRSATKVPDEKGRLPIHFAAAYGASVKALESLVATFPRSVENKENSGRTPLHYVMSNAHGNASPTVLRFLLDKIDRKMIDDTDDEGNLPLHLMSTRVETMNKGSNEDEKQAQNVIDCLGLYLDAEPRTSADFLTALQSLPGWLRDEAVTHSHIQQALNRKISKQFPTGILFLDCYFYILIISCFSYAARAHIQFRFGAEDLPTSIGGAITMCYLGVTYFFLRGLVTMMSMISLNTFRAWLMNAENWFDILVIGLIYHYCSAMQRRQEELYELSNFGAEDDYSFRTGVAFTLGALWLSVTTFLKSTMLEFSVFFESVLYVTRKLFIFMLSLIVILVNFSLMFLIVFRKSPVCSQECMADYGVFPHCHLNDSLLKVYTMMLGEIGEVNRYQQSLTAQILYVAFVFLVVILLSNILIAIVTDSHNIIKNERAEIVFWSNRLDFVAEMDAIVAMRKRLCQYIPCCGQTYSRELQEEGAPNHERKKITRYLSTIWSNIISFLKEETSGDTSIIEVFLFAFLRLFVIILVMPIWFALGLMTAGALWPAQVREFLFLMGSYRGSYPLTNQFDDGVKNMKEDITSLKTAFLTDVDHSKHDYETIQSDIDDIRTDVKSEMLEVKRKTKRMIGLLKKHRSSRGDNVAQRRRSSQGGSSGDRSQSLQRRRRKPSFVSSDS